MIVVWCFQVPRAPSSRVDPKGHFPNAVMAKRELREDLPLLKLHRQTRFHKSLHDIWPHLLTGKGFVNKWVQFLPDSGDLSKNCFF